MGTKCVSVDVIFFGTSWLWGAKKDKEEEEGCKSHHTTDHQKWLTIVVEVAELWSVPLPILIDIQSWYTYRFQLILYNFSSSSLFMLKVAFRPGVWVTPSAAGSECQNQIWKIPVFWNRRWTARHLAIFKIYSERLLSMSVSSISHDKQYLGRQQWHNISIWNMVFEGHDTHTLTHT